MKTIKFLALGSFLALGLNLSAQNFNMTPYIGNDGVMEVGKYIDFHNSNSNVVDNEGRLQSDNGLLRVLNTSLYLAPTGEKYGWSNTNLFWSGHSLVMGSPTGLWSHNRLELKPGGSSAGDCENEFMLYRTKTDLTSECKVKFSTGGNNYILNHLGLGTSDPTSALSVGVDHGIKLSIGNSSWNRKSIVETAWNTTVGDFAVFSVPGFVENKSFLSLVQDGRFGLGTYNPSARFELFIPQQSTPIKGLDVNVQSFNSQEHKSNSYFLKAGDQSDNSNVFIVKGDGNVGIGTTNTGSHKLAVEGSIGAREVRVYLGEWADFVFEKDYKLPSLEEVEEHIQENGHLKDIPSAAVVAQEGISVGEMNARLLQKVEELTLYMIEQNKQIQALQSQVNTLSK